MIKEKLFEKEIDFDRVKDLWVGRCGPDTNDSQREDALWLFVRYKNNRIGRYYTGLSGPLYERVGIYDKVSGEYGQVIIRKYSEGENEEIRVLQGECTESKTLVIAYKNNWGFKKFFLLDKNDKKDAKVLDVSHSLPGKYTIELYALEERIPGEIEAMIPLGVLDIELKEERKKDQKLIICEL